MSASFCYIFMGVAFLSAIKLKNKQLKYRNKGFL